jgi:cation diffusion facilitator CzcD-associated flavoprotein CzcO
MIAASRYGTPSDAATPEQCDVLIVGAGPAGLMLANQLVRLAGWHDAR